MPTTRRNSSDHSVEGEQAPSFRENVRMVHSIAQRDGASISKRILIADADEDTRLQFCEAVEHAGGDVIEAVDGREALIKALVRSPALVICELNLPIIDGYALCEILRRDRATAAIPILIVTNEARSSEVARAKRSGADVVLIKPTTPAGLLQEIRQLMTRSASPSQESAHVTIHAEGQRQRLAKAYVRSTTTSPPRPPLELFCPTCSRPLEYECSHVGGVNAKQPEQWDDFWCSSCRGTFEYRQRTRRLRQNGCRPLGSISTGGGRRGR